MSVILRPRSTPYSTTGLGLRPKTGRGLATLVTGAAMVIALVLVATIPVRAGVVLAPVGDSWTGPLGH